METQGKKNNEHCDCAEIFESVGKFVGFEDD